MVEPKLFKEKIREIISQQYEIIFLGDDFDKTISKITQEKAEKIYEWVFQVTKNKIIPIMKNYKKKKYKNIPLTELLSFRKEIQISGNDHRIMLIKIKGSYYIEFHIGQHKYYDRLRKDLGLTKKNY